MCPAALRERREYFSSLLRVFTHAGEKVMGLQGQTCGPPITDTQQPSTHRRITHENHF